MKYSAEVMKKVAKAGVIVSAMGIGAVVSGMLAVLYGLKPINVFAVASVYACLIGLVTAAWMERGDDGEA